MRTAGLAPSSYYYDPEPESAETLALLRRLDQLYLDHPYYGSLRLAVVLSQEFSSRSTANESSA